MRPPPTREEIRRLVAEGKLICCQCDYKDKEHSMLSLEEIRRHFATHDALCRHLGIEIVEVDAERSVTSMPLDERHLNGMGNTHGAALFALMDVTFAALSNSGGAYCTSAQASVSFLAPARSGPLRCEARVIRAGRKLGAYDVRVTDAEGGLVAVATVTGYATGAPLPVERQAQTS